MKDNWIDLLFNLFQKSLNQLKEEHELTMDKVDSELMEESAFRETPDFIQVNDSGSTRVLSTSEQAKLTKPGYQFLMRMKLAGLFSNESFEHIMNAIHFSDSRIVNLEETKWLIRKILANKLDSQQLAFLDLVLYHRELAMPLH